MCIAAKRFLSRVPAGGVTASPSSPGTGSACMKPGCEVEMFFGKHNIILIINYLETPYRNSFRSLLPEGCFCSQGLYQLLSGNCINTATKMQTVAPLIKQFGISQAERCFVFLRYSAVFSAGTCRMCQHMERKYQFCHRLCSEAVGRGRRRRPPLPAAKRSLLLPGGQHRKPRSECSWWRCQWPAVSLPGLAPPQSALPKALLLLLLLLTFA